MPATPPIIYVPPSAGAPPATPAAVFGPAPAGMAILLISATTGITGTANGPVAYVGLVNSRAAWSSNGTLTPSATNTIVQYTGSAWSVSRGSVYAATLTSAAATPAGLTAWTMATGTGSPVIAAFAAAAPPVIFIP